MPDSFRIGFPEVRSPDVFVEIRQSQNPELHSGDFASMIEDYY